jgi:SAM-dependent methyltransferase
MGAAQDLPRGLADVDLLPHAAGTATARTSADALLPLVLEILCPRSVLDIGCGTGGWLASFADLGIDDIVGVDESYVREHLLIAETDFVAADVTQTFDLDRQFDLVVSVEVGEHLEPSAAETYIENITNHGQLVLFSAACVGQGGPGHVNLQWPSYWASLFDARGFVSSDPFRRRIWNDQRIAWWYRQNLIVFGREMVLRNLGLPIEEPLALVHPGLIEEGLDPLLQYSGREAVIDLVKRLGRRAARLAGRH